MRRSVDFRPRLAVDLGCGPGYSTRLVARTLNPERTVGLDNSKSFLAHARATAYERVSFHLHDITTAPFPTGLCDVMFSRFELTHLRDPESVVQLWVGQLRVGGLLLIEEVEYIDTSDSTLNSYQDMQQAMLKRQGNALYIGPRLDAIIDSRAMRRRSSEVEVLKVEAKRAARMFLMNFGVWRHNDFVQRSYGPTVLDDLESQLSAIAEGRIETAPVEWGLRQIVMERVA